MPDYIERSMPARTLQRGDMLATWNGRKVNAVYRRVERVFDQDDGTVSVIIAGSAVPQVMPGGTSVVVRVRRRV
jgi:hypothetical protein